MEPKVVLTQPLTSKIQRIEDLADKLVYIKWCREFFVLLQRAAHDLLHLVGSQSEPGKIATLAEQLHRQASQSLDNGELPTGLERERLIAIAGALCQVRQSLENAPSGQGAEINHNGITEPLSGPLFLKWDGNLPLTVAEARIWLVAPEAMRPLAQNLQHTGSFQVELLPGLSEVRKRLMAKMQPEALLIDLDQVTHDSSILQQIVTLRQMLAADIPILFMAERGDITARLEAVEIGGAGYFSKPVDIPLLVETLSRWISSKSDRILIIDETLSSAREIARALETQGLTAQPLSQPLQLLQAIGNFQPGLLIFNLDTKDFDGIRLAQVIRQHEQLHELPLILLSAQSNASERLFSAGLSGEVLLSNPPELGTLLATVTGQLRQGRNCYRKASQISRRDIISGLYNRPYFLSRLDRALIAANANLQSLAILLISLDNLRLVETLDAAAADRIVREAAQRLQATLGAGPIIARFGDAVFTVLLGFTTQEGLVATGDAVQSCLENEPYSLHSNAFQLRVSIGISIADSAKSEASLLIHRADLACGMARDSKDKRVYIHHSQVIESKPERFIESKPERSQQQQLLEEIREAVQQQRMNLLFQPIVSLRGDSTERYEVLLRMRNQAGWELLPETVFGLVRHHRLGMALDRWVIARAIRSLRERLKRGRTVVLFINVSPTILQDAELFNWLHSGLQKTEVPANSLVFELSETTAQINKHTLPPFLQRLKTLGCGLALDRFSGHERGLALAQLLDIDYVKLENRYTQDLPDNKALQAELSTLARQLTTQGVTPVLTGIENSATLATLWSCGIDYVQGFILQRPHTDMSFDFEHMAL